MDNVTHSLIGLTAGEALARFWPKTDQVLSPATRRNLFVMATVIGGNLPDMDLLYSYFGHSNANLAYMLEHRGYTHTLLGCVLLAVALDAGLEAYMHQRRLIASRADHVALFAVALVGTGLHLAMDALNSYGVHPFWPFQNRWIYGDSLFIVEPAYWVAAAPLLFLLRSVTAKCALIAALAIALLAGAFSAQVPLEITACLALAAVAMIWVGWRCSARTAVNASVLAFMLITLIFVSASRIAAYRIRALAAADLPTARIIDDVLTPLPDNPFCWDVLVLQIQKDNYLSRGATLSLAPSLISPARCLASSKKQKMLVPQTEPTASDDSTIRWREFSMPLARLRSLVDGNCDSAALMRFARAPFVIPQGTDWLIGDQRFDRGPRPGFSVLRVAKSNDSAVATDCPRTPPWDSPRAELLQR